MARLQQLLLVSNTVAQCKLQGLELQGLELNQGFQRHILQPQQVVRAGSCGVMGLCKQVSPESHEMVHYGALALWLLVLQLLPWP